MLTAYVRTNDPSPHIAYNYILFLIRVMQTYVRIIKYFW